MRMSALDWVVWILLFVGGLNWGLVGLFDYNLVSGIFGVDTPLTNIIYILVGLAAVWSLISLFMKSSKDTAAPGNM